MTDRESINIPPGAAINQLPDSDIGHAVFTSNCRQGHRVFQAADTPDILLSEGGVLHSGVMCRMFGVRKRLQMVGVNASLVFTSVMNMDAFRHRTIGTFECDHMGAIVAPIPSETAIALNCAADPVPTAGSGIDLVSKRLPAMMIVDELDVLARNPSPRLHGKGRKRGYLPATTETETGGIWGKQCVLGFLDGIAATAAIVKWSFTHYATIDDGSEIEGRLGEAVTAFLARLGARITGHSDRLLTRRFGVPRRRMLQASRRLLRASIIPNFPAVMGFSGVFEWTV